MDQRHVWRGVGIATGLAAGLATRWLLVKVWTRVEGDEPPGNPAAPGAAEAWKTATGSYPEGLEESRA